MENSTMSFKAKYDWPFKFGQYLEVDIEIPDGAKSLNVFVTNEKQPSDHFRNATFSFNDAISHGVHIFFSDIVKNKITVNNGRGSILSFESIKSNNLKGIIKLNIHISEESFFIAVNGTKRFRIGFGFEARTTDRQINPLKGFLAIAGDVKRIVNLNYRQIYPKVWPPSLAIKSAHAFANEIPQPFQPGHLTILRGQFSGMPSGRFIVQLHHLFSQAEVFVLHARFDEQAVVRYALLLPYLNYGKEERDGIFPFDIDRPFCMGIAFKEKELIVAVDGKEVCTFVYRYRAKYPLENFGHLRVIDEGGTVVRITEISHAIMDQDHCNLEKLTK